MTQEVTVELNGKLCPFPVVEIIRESLRLQPGQRMHFCVDDPLAIKSVPEELEDYDDLEIVIDKKEHGWMISVSRT